MPISSSSHQTDMPHTRRASAAAALRRSCLLHLAFINHLIKVEEQGKCEKGNGAFDEGEKTWHNKDSENDKRRGKEVRRKVMPTKARHAWAGEPIKLAAPNPHSSIFWFFQQAANCTSKCVYWHSGSHKTHVQSPLPFQSSDTVCVVQYRLLHSTPAMSFPCSMKGCNKQLGKLDKGILYLTKKHVRYEVVVGW